MKKSISILLLLFFAAYLPAQIKVTFIVKEHTAIEHDSIFITGSFSNWDSTANPIYLMKPHGKRQKSITLNVKAGTIRYKFHRGSWFSVEKQFDMTEVPDRIVTIRKDTVLRDEVWAWRNQFFMDKWKMLSMQIPDTTRIGLLASLANIYAFNTEFINTDSAFYYTQQALQLVQKMKTSNNLKKGMGDGISAGLQYLQELTAALLHSLGNYPKALEMRLENLKLAEKAKDKFQLVDALGNITSDYLSMQDYQSMLYYAKQQDSVLATLNSNDNRYYPHLRWSKANIATALYRLKNLSAALAYAKQARDLSPINSGLSFLINHRLLADIYAALNESDSALINYRQIIPVTPVWAGHFTALAQAGMAKVFQYTGRIDSALYFGRQALNYFQSNKMTVRAMGETSLYYVAEISPMIAALYKANNQPDSAYKYLQLSIAAKDSLYNVDKIRQFQTLSFNEANRQQQLEQQSREEKQRYETKLKMYGLISIITGFVLLALILYRNNRQKQKANTLLQSQKQEIEKTLGELQHTQKQLIQSEKLASLGELTAGIAHEIQNPLNFVNNFAEVSAELIEEMESEFKAGKPEDAFGIAADIKLNLSKINHHGQRASSIVKGMLEHSRASTGVKEPTDINVLADEYLRLAYHGLRAKDNSFNATIETHFDPDLPLVSVISQDIGRVLLNLINNAFYAVAERSRSTVGASLAGAHAPYHPTVTVSTKKTGDQIIIKVQDNGNGIPESIREKIFQPFFTTKPTGQGTGLGLSLAYDIVTNGHGGSLEVVSTEEHGTIFSMKITI